MGCLCTSSCRKPPAVAAQIDALERGLTAQGPTWLGFCHNDTQYGNMLLHKASPLPESCWKRGVEDLLDAQASLSEQPASSVEASGAGVKVELGFSPPSFSSLLKISNVRPLWPTYHTLSVTVGRLACNDSCWNGPSDSQCVAQ